MNNKLSPLFGSIFTYLPANLVTFFALNPYVRHHKINLLGTRTQHDLSEEEGRVVGWQS